MTKEIIQRWERTGLLNGINEDKKESIALALQSQHEYNEKTDSYKQFQLVSIPLVRRVLPTLEFVNKPLNQQLITDIDMNPDLSFYTLDQQAEWTADVALQLNHWLREHYKKNGSIAFNAFGVVNGKIALC